MSKENNSSDNFQYIEWEAGEILWQKDLDNNRLMFLLDGEMEVIYGSLNPRIVGGGNVLLLTSLTNCVCKTLTPVKIMFLDFHHLNFNCDKFVIQKLTPIFTLLKYEFQVLDIRSPLDVFIELMEEYLKIDNFAADFYAEKSKELFILLRAYYDAEELTMLFYPLLGKNMDFKKLLIDNYSRVRNASEYADLCGFSLCVFQRKFKEVFGETVYQWMQRQKAEQIKHYLMVTDISLKELSLEFNFASPAHLNKFCKIWFGMTPTELRQTYFLRKNLK